MYKIVRCSLYLRILYFDILVLDKLLLKDLSVWTVQSQATEVILPTEIISKFRCGYRTVEIMLIARLELSSLFLVNIAVSILIFVSATGEYFADLCHFFQSTHVYNYDHLNCTSKDMTYSHLTRRLII